MARKHHTAEQIIGKLRQAEVMLGEGGDREYARREIGSKHNTLYPWRQGYEGLARYQDRRSRDLEAGYARLKRAVADLTVDNQILKEISKGKF